MNRILIREQTFIEKLFSDLDHPFNNWEKKFDAKRRYNGTRKT